MTRGVVLPLTLAQIATRAKYLGQLTTSDKLDDYVLVDGMPLNKMPPRHMVDGFYLLQEHNGNRDPRAPDPFARWVKSPYQNAAGELITPTFVNRTADCCEGAYWAGGFDRQQKVRFAHLYDGDINTNSMLLDAFGPRRCFEPLDRPVPGCFVVAPTHAKGFEECGHIGTVYAVPPEWDPDVYDCWRHVLVVDVAKRDPHAANRARSDGAGIWFAARHGANGLRSAFVRSIMAP